MPIPSSAGVQATAQTSALAHGAHAWKNGVRLAGLATLLALIYFLAGQLGLLMAIPPGVATPVWPPSGIALAAVILLGPRVWPGVWLGSFVLNLSVLAGAGQVEVWKATAVAAGIASGSSIQPLLGASLLRHTIGTRNPLARTRDALRFSGLCGALSCTTSATVGVTSVCLAGIAAWPQFPSNWVTWWLGDAAGVLILTPLLLSWNDRAASGRPYRWLELALCFALVLSIASLMFSAPATSPFSERPLAFLLIPFLLWAAFRFGPQEALGVLVVVSAMSVWGTVNHKGPFALESLAESRLLLEVFLAVAALTALIVGAAVTERRTAEATLRQVNVELETRVRERTVELLQANAALQAEVHERQGAQAALAASESRLRAIIEAEPECVKTLDRNGCVLQMNPAGLAMIEARDFEQVAGHRLVPFIAPEHRAMFEESIAAGFRGESRLLEFEIVGLKGARRWLESHSVPLPDPAHPGEVAALLAVTRDVTERRHAEAALRRSREDYVELVNSVPGLVWEADARTMQFRFVSQQAERMLGYPVARWIAEPDFWRDHLHPEDREWATRYCLESARRMVAPEFEYRMIAANGRVVWLRGLVDVDGAGGEATTLRGIMVDITSRKHAEQERARLTAILENTTDLVATTDPEGRLLYVNHAGRRLLGISDEEVLSMLRLSEFQSSAAPENGLEDAFAHATRDGSWQGESTFLGRDDHSIPLSQVIIAHRGPSGTVEFLSMVARDVSERRRAESERLEMERSLLETQKLESLGVLAGGIAHDFNNILTGILGNTNLAQMNLPPTSAVQSYLDKVVRSSKRAAELCRQMLAYSGRGRFVVRRLNLNSLIEDTTNLLHLSISKKAELRFQLAEDLPAVEADATQLRQLIMNLVMNASEALCEQPGLIRLKTAVQRIDQAFLAQTHHAPEATEGEYVLVEVSDTGCGMDAETIAKLFDPFFTTKFIGRGLGLSAVLGIMRGHHGALVVKSEPGRGTVVRLLLPRADGVVDESTPPASDIAGWRGHGTVLVVEDDADVRSLAVQHLSSLGFRVVEAVDGRSGVVAFHANAGELTAVLLDLTMPQLNGAEAFAEMQRIRPDVPILLMSGFDEEDAIRDFGGGRLAGFLRKPFTLAELQQRLQAILA